MSKLSEQLIAFLILEWGDDVAVSGGLERLQGGFDTDTFASRFRTPRRESRKSLSYGFFAAPENQIVSFSN